MDSHVKQFEGHVGIVPEHDSPLKPPGVAKTALLQIGWPPTDEWETLGTIHFGPGGRKTVFAPTEDVEQRRMLGAIPERQWQGKEASADTRRTFDQSLIRTAFRLADQMCDVRDIDFYHDNPVQLPQTGHRVLRTVWFSRMTK